MNRHLYQLLLFVALVAAAGFLQAAEPLFDMKAIRDPSTLEVKVIKDWHEVGGPVNTRRKTIEIHVGELWEGQEIRVPVRFIVPADRKAKGFYLNGALGTRNLDIDFRVSEIESELLKGGVGIVSTVVSAGYPSKQLHKEMVDRFRQTLNPHYLMEYWGWPAILMRAITAVHAEKGHFEPGKIAMSGRSKRGASPSVVLNVDSRTTALHAAASPIAASPIRLCDTEAWTVLEKYDLACRSRRPNQTLPFSGVKKHFAAGGMYGLNHTPNLLIAGHKWEDLQQLAARLKPHVFISENLVQLKERKVDMLFHPGTHDYICYDVPWIGTHIPEIPVYLRVNSTHASKGDENVDPGEANLSAFLLNHFFQDAPDLLSPPKSDHRIADGQLHVTISFPANSQSETGDVYWMYNRPPSASRDYLNVKFPGETRKAMRQTAPDTWTATIALEAGVSHIDVFSTHRKTISRGSTKYATYLTSPYTRISLK
jgi:hypothetical protein